jgi:hypothetical protein
MTRYGKVTERFEYDELDPRRFTVTILEDDEELERQWIYWHLAVHNSNYEPETAWYALNPD